MTREGAHPASGNQYHHVSQNTYQPVEFPGWRLWEPLSPCKSQYSATYGVPWLTPRNSVSNIPRSILGRAAIVNVWVLNCMPMKSNDRIRTDPDSWSWWSQWDVGAPGQRLAVAAWISKSSRWFGPLEIQDFCTTGCRIFVNSRVDMTNLKKKQVNWNTLSFTLNRRYFCTDGSMETCR